MLLRTSVADHYELIYSGDPALATPDDPNDPAWVEKLERARDTGDWGPLLKPGEEPSVFVFKNLPGSQWRRVMDVASSVGPGEGTAIIFRASVKSVRGLGDFQVRTERHQKLGEIAKDDVIDLLDGIAVDIVRELANVAMTRAREGLRPK
jgi:hypothetical protein